MFETLSIIFIIGTHLIVGLTKGNIGLGLPTIILTLLTILTNLPTSMALLLLPSLVTNIWQAIVGVKIWAIIIRLWPLFLTAIFTVWFGVMALSSFELTLLSALFGTLLMTYAVINIFGFRFNINTRYEWWVGSLVCFIIGAKIIKKHPLDVTKDI